MTDVKLRALWGDDLFNYAYQKSIELIGYPDYPTMALAAIGRIQNTIGVAVATN